MKAKIIFNAVELQHLHKALERPLVALDAHPDPTITFGFDVEIETEPAWTAPLSSSPHEGAPAVFGGGDGLDCKTRNAAKPAPRLTDDEVREALKASDDCGKTRIDVLTHRLNVLLHCRTAKPQVSIYDAADGEQRLADSNSSTYRDPSGESCPDMPGNDSK